MITEAYRQKVVTAEAAAAALHNGDTALVSGGASSPGAFLEALSARPDLTRVTVISPLALTPPEFVQRQQAAVQVGKSPRRGIRFSCFDVGPAMKAAACSGVVDVLPANARAMAALMRASKLDVLVVGSPGMDPEGNFNLGCNVDWMPDMLSMAEQAETLVIVEVNPNLPHTEGETTFRLESVDYVVVTNRKLPEVGIGSPLLEAHAIGAYVSSLVPDEATLHLDASDVVRQVAVQLDTKRDLGVHSDFIGDPFLYLKQRGALTCRRKSFMPNKWVGCYVLGSGTLYDYVNGNDTVGLYPVTFVAEAANIARNQKMVSITRACQVDLTGQVAGVSPAYEMAGNPGTQQVFHAAASLSSGGKGIVVLPSTSESHSVSNVVAHLTPGHVVSIPRTEVDTVVTENGVASLRGASVRQRVLSLIAVAHPAHRDRLASEARSAGLI